MFSYCSTWHSKSSWQLTGLLRGDTWTMGVGLCVIASRKFSNRARAWTSCVSISLQVRCPTLSISLHAFKWAGKKWTDREVGRWASVSFVESSWPRTIFLCRDALSAPWCSLSFVTSQPACNVEACGLVWYIEGWQIWDQINKRFEGQRKLEKRFWIELVFAFRWLKSQCWGWW